MKFLKFLNKHKGKIIIILLIIAAVCYYAFNKKKPEVKEEILMHTIKNGTISETLRKDGAIAAKYNMEINSTADGRITKMFVKEGDRVVKGQKLVTIAPGQNIYEKYVPIDVTATMDGLVLRCLNDRMSSRSKVSYELPKEGEYIQGSSSNPTCLMKIIKENVYVLPFKVGEYEIDKLHIGMPIKIKISSKPNLDIDGKITLISPQPEIKEESRWDDQSSKVEFIVVAETQNYKGPIILGLTATAEINLGTYNDVLIVPLNAVYEERDFLTQNIKYFVYKEIAPKKAKKIEIKLGAKDDMQAEILNPEELGLKEDDKIFLDIKGDKIEVEEDKSNPKKGKKIAAKTRGRGNSISGTVNTK